LLKRCDLALFPMATASQTPFALRALAGGARVLAAAKGVLEEIPGLFTVPGASHWEEAVAAALQAWIPPREQWLEDFGGPALKAAWRQAYQAAGLCT
jgi:hypothetical protein